MKLNNLVSGYAQHCAAKMSIHCYSVAVLLTAVFAVGRAEAQCPTTGIGTATGCGIIISVSAVDAFGNATAFTVAPTNPDGSPRNNGNPYDGSPGDDTLVGIVNNDPTHPLLHIPITSTSFALGFDGDGPCAFNANFCYGGAVHTGTLSCSGGSACYEGPHNTFTVTDPPTGNHGAIDFTTAVAANGGSDWLALEGTPNSLTPPTMQVKTTPANDLANNSTDTTVTESFNSNPLVQADAIFPPGSDLTPAPGINDSTLQFQETNRFVSDCGPYTIGTPFATCKPFDHAGNDAISGTLGNGAKYEIICSDGNEPFDEANCPTPTTGKHIRFKEIFDLPKDSSNNPVQPTINFGTTASAIHWYPGLGGVNLASWSPSTAPPHPNCTNVFTATFACSLEDALVNLSGDPTGYTSDTKKGDYLLVSNIPMPCSAWNVISVATSSALQLTTPVNTPCTQGSSVFFVHSPVKFDFVASPAKCPTYSGEFCGNGWIAAPVNDVFYTFDLVGSAPDLPGATDFEDTIKCPGTGCPPQIPNGVDCNVNSTTTCPVTSGAPGASSTANVEFTTTQLTENEGQYELQVSTADTVKIRERNIQILPVQPAGMPNPCPNPFGDNPQPPCYSTKLFNAQITVDNTIPTISSGPTLSAPGVTPITVTYTCSDTGSAVANSGIAICGATSPGTTHNVSPPGGPGAGPSSVTETDTLPSATGSYSFTVQATDVAGNLSAPSQVNYTVYGLCTLYNTGAAVKLGATYPIKFYLCNGGTDMSSSSIIVHATQVIQTSTSTSDPVVSAGNANPDNDFRFDSTLGPSGGYIFNLKTGSPLTSGNWVIQFTVTGDPTLHTLPFAVK